MEVAGLSARLHARESDDRTIITDPDTGRNFVPGETSTERTIYNAVAMFCVITLAILLGSRAKTLCINVFRKRNFTSILVLALYIFGLSFIICASVLQTGQGLRTYQLCYSSAIVCLVFYTGSKLSIYIFHLERARVVRAPFVPRLKDRIWLLGMLIICSGFGAIAIVGYLSPVVELSKLDGRCRIGLPPRVSFPLLCFDVFVNLSLTGLFFWLLRPVLNFHGLLNASSWFGDKSSLKVKNVRKREAELASALQGASLKSAVNKNMKTLLWKCLIGSTLVMLPTVASMTQFYMMKSRELSWIGLTVCTLDISWGVIVVNWLTIGSAEAENNITMLMSQRTLRNDQPSRSSKRDAHSRPNSRLDNGLTTHDYEPYQEMRTRQASVTTAEVPVFYMATNLNDEGDFLRHDSVRDSWIKENEVDESDIECSQVREPERTWGANSKGWAGGSKSWVTINDRILSEESYDDTCCPFRMV